WFAEAEDRPGAFEKSLDQAGVRQQFEMTRYARLRLPQDFAEIRYGELALGQERQDPQSCPLPGRLEGVVERVERKLDRRGHWVLPMDRSHKDMFIRLKRYSQGSK